MADLTEVTVTFRPSCDFCGSGEALYNAKTIYGPWAYMCQRHFDSFEVGLGTGKGQRLVMKRDA